MNFQKCDAKAISIYQSEHETSIYLSSTSEAAPPVKPPSAKKALILPPDEDDDDDEDEEEGEPGATSQSAEARAMQALGAAMKGQWNGEAGSRARGDAAFGSKEKKAQSRAPPNSNIALAPNARPAFCGALDIKKKKAHQRQTDW